MHSKKDPVRYKKLSPRSVFDFLDLEKDGKQAVYPMKLRIVRFLLDTGEYECIVTNLKRDAFPPWRIKELYHLRWGIETSFRKLKYSVGLSCFHSKKAEYVEQEIYARVIMYNFCESITPHVSTHQKKKQNTLTRWISPWLYISVKLSFKKAVLRSRLISRHSCYATWSRSSPAGNFPVPKRGKAL